MWVVNSGANSVNKLTSNGQVVQTISVGQHRMGIAFDGHLGDQPGEQQRHEVQSQ